MTRAFNYLDALHSGGLWNNPCAPASSELVQPRRMYHPVRGRILPHVFRPSIVKRYEAIWHKKQTHRTTKKRTFKRQALLYLYIYIILIAVIQYIFACHDFKKQGSRAAVKICVVSLLFPPLCAQGLYQKKQQHNYTNILGYKMWK